MTTTNPRHPNPITRANNQLHAPGRSTVGSTSTLHLHHPPHAPSRKRFLPQAQGLRVTIHPFIFPATQAYLQSSSVEGSLRGLEYASSSSFTFTSSARRLHKLAAVIIPPLHHRSNRHDMVLSRNVRRRPRIPRAVRPSSWLCAGTMRIRPPRGSSLLRLGLHVYKTPGRRPSASSSSTAPKFARERQCSS